MSTHPDDFQRITDLTKSYLSFRLAEEIFAVPVMKVLEILEVPKITKVPQTPLFMNGVINLRGDVLPVIDTRIKFGLEAAAFDINTSVLVVNVQEGEDTITLCILVDSVIEVFELEDEQIKPSPSIGSKYQADFIEGMVNHQEEFIMLLNIDEIFSLMEIQSILSTEE